MSEPQEEKTTYHELEIKVRVVTDREWEPGSLSDVAYHIGEGDFCGVWEIVKNDEVTAKQAAELLVEFDSEPGFFGLDEEGDEEDEADEEDELSP